jgi:hypothetical protein
VGSPGGVRLRLGCVVQVVGRTTHV